MAKAPQKTALLLIETLNRGGIENVLIRLIPKLEQEGWSSIVMTIGSGGEMYQEYIDRGITVVTLDQTAFFHPRTLRLIAARIHELDPDIVMTNLFKADVIGRIFLRFAIKQPVVPYLVTTYNHPRYWIARVFEWFTKPLALKYIANSNAVQLFYEKRLGVRRGKIVVAPNGVDTDVFAAADAKSVQQEFALPKDAFVVTCVANLAANKGQADLLTAFERVFATNPKAFLFLVGDGEQRQALLDQRVTLQSKDRIILLGRRTDVPAILKATSVFVLPTLFEGMSTAILEAMAARRAIITTNIPENKVLVTHDESALLVDPKSPDQIAAALKTLSADPALRTRLSDAAFADVEAKYSVANTAHIISDIFNDLTEVNPYRRVVHIIGSLDIGGAEQMLLKTLPLLDRDTYEHIVITLFRPGELAPEFAKRNITVIHCELRSLFDLRGLRALVQHVHDQQPALVITYLFQANAIGRLYLRQRINAPIIPFLRTTYNYNQFRYRFARFFEYITKNAVTHWFANSDAVKEFYVTRIKVDPARITVIPNGIDVSIYERPAKRPRIAGMSVPPKSLVVTCVANLAPSKGHSFLLEAFNELYRQCPHSYLLIVGDGQERAALEEQATGYPSKEHILFLGRRSDVAQILTLTDIFVLPTLFEGLSNALLEAMAAACAVITTDIPENRVIITDQETGLLVPPSDVPALAAALVAVAKDTGQRHAFGQRAKAFIDRSFNLQHTADELDDAIKAYAQPFEGV
jgi:glycosyltransferase involved in cell wall biosynthesis